MPSDLARDRRRSTRVRLNVAIEAQGVAEPLKCEGETAVVNLHGAFISTAIPLRVGMIVDIFVVVTGKCARATVVYVNREQPRFCLQPNGMLVGSGAIDVAGRVVTGSTASAITYASRSARCSIGALTARNGN